MRKSNSTTKAPATYEQQARRLVTLYFSPATPDFVRDLLSSWLTELEQETQTLLNDRRVLRVVLPIMLRKAKQMGIEVNDAASGFCRDVFLGSIHTNHPSEINLAIHSQTRPRGVSEEMWTEIEKDADALVRITSSPRTPDDLKNAVLDGLSPVLEGTSYDPDVVRLTYARKLAAARNGSKSQKEVAK